jgi:hypothetical protein
MLDRSDPRYTKKKAKSPHSKTLPSPKPKKPNKELAKVMKPGGRKSIG